MEETSVTTEFQSHTSDETTFMISASLEPIQHYDEMAVIILAVILVFMSLFGILANGTTIWVVSNSPNLSSVFNYFILSLSVSDLISAIISPLYLYRKSWGFVEWNIPKFLCKVYWSVDNGTSVLTSLHIMVFSGLRFISLKFPHKFKRWFTIKKARPIILVLWLISIAGGFAPFAVWMGIKNFRPEYSFIPICSVERTSYRQPFMLYSLVGYALFFFLPCVMIIVFSCGASILLIARRIKRVKNLHHNNLDQNEIRRQRKENRAIFQLLLIIGSYSLGYFPNAISFLVAAIAPANNSRMFVWWQTIVFYLLLRISECLNPVFYNLASSKMWKETAKFLNNIFPCCQCRKKENQNPH